MAMCAMRALILILTFAISANTLAAKRDGLVVLSETALAVPEDAKRFPLPGGDFEGDSWPASILAADAMMVTADDAPQGKRFGQITMSADGLIIRGKAGILGQPHVFSMWVKTAAEISIQIGSVSTALASTGGKWRHLACYFLLPDDDIRLHAEDGTRISFDALERRSASWQELALAYDREHARYPRCDNRHSADAGKNLALSVAKWQGKAGLPEKPFVIGAVDSSWTRFLGYGLPLLLAIRMNFPEAPLLVYKTIEDPMVSERADLILMFPEGSAAEMDARLSKIRRHSTADILTGSLPDSDDAAMREVCRKHRAQFAEIHRELAAYRKRHDLAPDALRQNAHGRIRIWDALCRRIAAHAEPAYAPNTRELRIPIEKVRSADGGRRIHLPFTGSRVDIIARKTQNGGKATVYIDGKFARQASPSALASIDFSGTGSFSETIVPNLPSGPHTLDLRISGEVEIEAFYVFTPPLPEE